MENLEERKDCEISHCTTMGNFTKGEKELVIRTLGKFQFYSFGIFPNNIYNQHLVEHESRLYVYYDLNNGKRLTYFY